MDGWSREPQVWEGDMYFLEPMENEKSYCFSWSSFSPGRVLNLENNDYHNCISEEAVGKNYLSLHASLQQCEPPSMNIIKIDVDAGFIANKGATGVIAQDHQGIFQGCDPNLFDASHG